MGHSHKTGSYIGEDDVHENPEILLAADQEMVRHIYRVTGEFDIPYLAGLSQTGLIYFRDRRIDDTFTFNGVTYNIDDFWIVHETVEWDHMHSHGLRRKQYLEMKWLEDMTAKILVPQRDTWEYQPAHQMALNAERRAVENRGIDWDWYNRWCDEWLWICDEQPEKCPPVLDLRPYTDEIVDGKVTMLEWIRDAGGPDSDLLHPPGERAIDY